MRARLHLLKKIKTCEFFMPGMVDTRIHASQYSYTGTALDLPLLEWLNTYTFPVEAKYKDLGFANNVYTKVVRRTVKNSPTTACYFATMHTDASLLLGELADKFGQRALVGKVCMDSNSAVPQYKESPSECKEETDPFIKELLKKGDCNGPTDEKLEIFRETGSAISHCPNSNISICSGMLNVRNVLNHKVKLGLGTDVAGGYSPSMLDAMRRTLDTSKTLTIQDPQHKTLSFEEVFRLATLGGSEALSLDDQIGNFVVGKDFDALRVNVCVPDGPIDLFPGEGPKVILEKFLNLGDNRNITEVYVAGRRVVPFPDT
ncbi:guanine deaminase-like [Sinocyclocheilus grahami]|uniref:guanine deaminase-like n=1 Tax=Sinocyclocheilus grahami TaxID=75366 RepID=UPI0007AD370F|nr:PREDICTED: guanine deaminase-like [Sinocyclocheilus grahami]